jgi:ferredoxin
LRSTTEPIHEACLMATMITDDCVSCGACEDECPNDAIRLGDEIFVIDPDRCSECVGLHATQKCAEACPVECCVPDPERREGQEVLLERARRIHPEARIPSGTPAR